MPSTGPPSSPPLHGIGSSSSTLSSSQFSSPHLPYRTIIHSLKASTLTENQQNSFLNRPSSPIAASEGFDQDYSEDEQENNNEEEDDECDRATAALADEEFLEKELVFNSESSSNSSLDESPADLVSDDSDDPDSATLSNNSRTFQTPATNRQPTCHTPMSSSSSSSYAREKLVRILNGDIPVPKQRWGMHRILATLTEHRKDPRLRLAYRQFKHFAYQTLLQKDEQLSKALFQKNWDTIIKLRAKTEIEKRYCREIQQLCRTPSFGPMNLEPGIIDKQPLENIVAVATEKAPLLSSMVYGVRPTSCLWCRLSSLHLVSMKLIAVLIILCHLAHRNNSNYLPLLIGLYLYSAGAKVDAITLLNQLGLSVSYNVLQTKLRDITSSSKGWIKQQAKNYQLVGTWDNFEYRENVHGERVGDIVKFRSITMALWVQKG